MLPSLWNISVAFSEYESVSFESLIFRFLDIIIISLTYHLKQKIFTMLEKIYGSNVLPLINLFVLDVSFEVSQNVSKHLFDFIIA